MARKPTKTMLSFSDYRIPVIHYKEYRASVRFSITKKGLIIRSPIFSSSSSLQSKAKSWCQNLAVKKPAALGKFKIKDYRSGDTISLMENKFVLDIVFSKGPKDTIHWSKDKLEIFINQKYSGYQKSEVIGQLLAKFAAKRFKEPLTRRVEEINKKFFNVEINQVRIKNNHSNWGSCSSKGNINLATRLLLAPVPVIDYVIIHELSHRIELNHSQRFWKLVADRCPDYKAMEKWLKSNSHLCEF